MKPILKPAEIELIKYALSTSYGLRNGLCNRDSFVRGLYVKSLSVLTGINEAYLALRLGQIQQL